MNKWMNTFFWLTLFCLIPGAAVVAQQGPQLPAETLSAKQITELFSGKTVAANSVDGKEQELVICFRTDGKVRQLRRMFSTLRHKIFYLRRVREGNLRTGNLAPGKWRYLTDEEILSIRKLAGPEKE